MKKFLFIIYILIAIYCAVISVLILVQKADAQIVVIPGFLASFSYGFLAWGIRPWKKES